jgi:hypothetical protein
MADIVLNQNVLYDGRAILCQLFCESCEATYCGSWRNDWISKNCRECGNGRVKPVIDYSICKLVFAPSGCLLN